MANAITRYLVPDNLAIVVVGDAQVIKAQLAAAGFEGVRVER